MLAGSEGILSKNCCALLAPPALINWRLTWACAAPEKQERVSAFMNIAKTDRFIVFHKELGWFVTTKVLFTAAGAGTLRSLKTSTNKHYVVNPTLRTSQQRSL
jgi:hypothetical protein